MLDEHERQLAYHRASFSFDAFLSLEEGDSETNAEKRKRQIVSHVLSELPKKDEQDTGTYWEYFRELETTKRKEAMEQSSTALFFVDEAWLSSAKCLNDFDLATKAQMPKIIFALDDYAWGFLTNMPVTHAARKVVNRIQENDTTREDASEIPGLCHNSPECHMPSTYLSGVQRILTDMGYINLCPCMPSSKETEIVEEDMKETIARFVHTPPGYKKKHDKLTEMAKTWKQVKNSPGQEKQKFLKTWTSNEENRKFDWRGWYENHEKRKSVPLLTKEQNEFLKAAEKYQSNQKTRKVFWFILAALVVISLFATALGFFIAERESAANAVAALERADNDAEAARIAEKRAYLAEKNARAKEELAKIEAQNALEMLEVAILEEKNAKQKFEIAEEKKDEAQRHLDLALIRAAEAAEAEALAQHLADKAQEAEKLAEQEAHNAQIAEANAEEEAARALTAERDAVAAQQELEEALISMTQAQAGEAQAVEAEQAAIQLALDKESMAEHARADAEALKVTAAAVAEWAVHIAKMSMRFVGSRSLDVLNATANTVQPWELKLVNAVLSRLTGYHDPLSSSFDDSSNTTLGLSGFEDVANAAMNAARGLMAKDLYPWQETLVLTGHSMAWSPPDTVKRMAIVTDNGLIQVLGVTSYGSAAVGADHMQMLQMTAAGNSSHTLHDNSTRRDHPKALAWGPDSLAASVSGGMVLWDMNENGTLSQNYTSLYRVNSTSFNQDECTLLAWSPTGLHLAAGCNQMVVIWPVSMDGTLQEPMLMPSSKNNTVTALAWDPQGENLAVADTSLSVFDVGARAPESQIQTLVENYNIVSVAWSPSGTLLAAGRLDLPALVFHRDANTGMVSESPVAILKEHPGSRVLAWSPSGRLLASGTDESTVRISTVTFGSSKTSEGSMTSEASYEVLEAGVDGGQAKVQSISWGEDDTEVAWIVGGQGPGGHTLRVWKFFRAPSPYNPQVIESDGTGELSSPSFMRSNDESVLQLAMIRLGRIAILAATENGSGRVAADLQVVECGESGDQCEGFAWSPSGLHLAVFTQQGLVEVLKVAPNGQVMTEDSRLELMGAGMQGGLQLAWSPSEDVLQIAAGGQGSNGTRIWTLEDDGQALHVVQQADIPGYSVEALAYIRGPWGIRLMSATVSEVDCRVDAFAVDSDGNLTAIPQQYELDGVGAVLSLAFSPNGRQLAVVHSRSHLSIFDVTAKGDISTRARQIFVLHGAVHDVSWSPLGSQLATVGDDGVIRLWEVADDGTVADGTSQRLESPGQLRCDSVAWSPSGRQLISVGDGVGHVWSHLQVDQMRMHLCARYHQVQDWALTEGEMGRHGIPKILMAYNEIPLADVVYADTVWQV